MRRLFFMLCLLGPLVFLAQKQTADLKAIADEMKFQEEAWNRGDIRGFMESYWHSDSLKFISKNGVTQGWDKTLNNYLKSYPTKEAMGILKFTLLEQKQLSSETCFVIGKWELSKKKPVGGYFSLLWKKVDGKWRIVIDHTS